MLEVASIVRSPMETEIVYPQDVQVQACPAVSEWLTGRVIVTSNFFFWGNLTASPTMKEKLRNELLVWVQWGILNLAGVWLPAQHYWYQWSNLWIQAITIVLFHTTVYSWTMQALGVPTTWAVENPPNCWKSNNFGRTLHILGFPNISWPLNNLGLNWACQVNWTARVNWKNSMCKWTSEFQTCIVQEPTVLAYW